MKKNIFAKMKKMKGILSTILVLSFSAILVGVGAKGNVDEADNNSSLLASDDSNKIVRNASTPAWNNPDDPEGYPSSQYGVYYNYHSYWSYGGVDDYWSSISNSMSIAFKWRDCWRYDDFSIFAINDGVTSSSSDITVNSDGTHTLTIQNAYRCVYQWVENFVYLGNGSPIAFYDSNKDGKYISRINFVKNSKLQVVSKYAFYNNSYLEEIDLSNCTNLTRIEDGAFENCVNLKKVILPDSVVSIGKNAFRGCTKLESSNNTQILNLEGVTYIGPNAFYGCSGTEFKTINLPSTLVTLGTQAFYNCENLEAITIPESVTQVGDATFYGCLHLTQARIYNKTLSAEEFSQCTSLASVTLNNEITVIPEKCFKNSTCTNLYRTIGADEENPDGNDTIQGFPLNLAIIKEEAFYGSSILKVNLPDATKTVGNSAFEACKAITTVDLNKITSLGERSFANCASTSLTQITIPETLVDSTEENGNTVFAIGSHAFAESVYINSATINNHQFGEYMFEGCSSLSNIKFNQLSQITEVAEGTFKDCTKFNDLELFKSSALTKIGSYAFSNTAYTNLTVLSTVNETGEYVLAYSKKLTSLTVNAKQIGAYFAYQCPLLDTVTIGSNANVTEASTSPIGRDAFAGNEKLVNITLDNTTYLGERMFADCEKLKFVTIPATVKAIEPGVFSRDVLLEHVVFENTFAGQDMFEYCQSLKAIEIPNFTKLDDYAFRNSYLESIVLPNSLETVGTGVFSNSYHLTSITFGNGIIGNEMFKDCTALESVTIPAGITEVRANAFDGCTKLTNITFENDKIGDYMFANCTGLYTITIPTNITSIGEHAFDGCTALGTVVNGVKGTINNESKIWSNYMFANCTGLTTITIENANKDKLGGYVFYKDSALTEIYYISDVISEHMFDSCISLQNVYFKLNGSEPLVKTIKNNAFENCQSLASITIPSSTTTVEDEVFKDCLKLATVEIAKEIQSLGQGLLYGCKKLVSLTIPFIGASRATKLNYDTNEHTLGYLFGSGWDGTNITQNYSKDNSIEYTIPNTLHTLVILDEEYYSYGALSNFKPVQAITLASNSHYLSDYVFAGCESLLTLQIPVATTKLGSHLFENCTSLTKVAYETDTTNKTAITVIPAYMFAGCTSLVDFVPSNSTFASGAILLENINTIEEYAFFNCSSLAKVGLNHSITVIPEHCFDGCAMLTRFADIKSTTEEEADGFYPNVEITTIMNYAFANCDSFTTVTIPATVTTLGEFVFSSCAKLISANLENNTLSDGLFAECEAFTSCYINPEITAIGAYAFYNDDNLIHFGFIGEEEDANGLQLTHKLTTIGAYAFYNCNKIGEVESEYPLIIGGKITVIGAYAFYGMTKIATFVIPDNITSMGEGVMSGWTHLENITLPFIGESTSATGINGVFGYMFGKAVVDGIEATNQPYQYNGSYSWTKYQNFYIPKTIKTVTMSNKLTRIPEFAFASCSFITTYNFPTKTNFIIETYALAKNTQLITLVIPNNCVRTDYGMLFGDYNLVELTMPHVGQNINSTGNAGKMGYIFSDIKYDNSYEISGDYGYGYAPTSLIKLHVTNESTIISYGIGYWYRLQELEISDSVQVINYYAFYRLYDLKKLTIPFVGYSRTSTGRDGTLAYILNGYDSSSGQYAVTQYYNNNGKIQTYGTYYLPKNFAELNVTDATQIAVGALSNITSLKKVTLNENNAKNKGILSVGAYAFYNLNQLEELTIPTSVKNIGEHVFEKCTGLQKLTVPYIGLDKDNYDDASSNEFGLWFGTEANAASNAVKQYTYKDSSSTSYYIPASLTEIVITNVKNLASYAFYGMTQLTNVKIERNEYSTIDCASFGSYVFYGCTGLTTFAIPEKLETLGVSIFENCTGLQSVSSGNNFTTIGQRMFAGCTGLYNFDFKDHIEIIDDEAFYGCVKLGAKTLNELFPDKYQTTTESSSRVNSIELNKVTTIGYAAFYGCTSLVNLTFNETLTKIGDNTIHQDTTKSQEKEIQGVFEDCINLESVIMNNIILSERIFANDARLNNFVVKEGTKIIPAQAFINCIGLTNITLSSTLEEIQKEAFKNCENLESVNLPEGLITIGDNAFENSGLKYVILPSTLGTNTETVNGSIGEYIFLNNTNLKKAVLRNALVGVGMFKNCTNLKNVFLNYGIVTIEQEAFMNTTNLTLVAPILAYQAIAESLDDTTSSDIKVEFPLAGENNSVVTVKTIKKSAFEGAESINNLNLNYIELVEDRAFYSCKAITSLSLPAMFNASGAKYVFAENINLRDLTILTPNLGKFMFFNDVSLDNVTLIEDTITAPESAFDGCTSLTTLQLPFSLLNIEKRAFAQTAIPTIEIREMINRLGDEAFKDATSLVSAYIYDLYFVYDSDLNLKKYDTIEIDKSSLKDEYHYNDSFDVNNFKVNGIIGSSKEVLDVNNYRIQLYYKGNEVSDFSFEGEYQIKLSYIGNDLCDEPVKRYSINFNFTDMDKLYLSKIVVNGVLVDISKNQFSYYIIVDKDITEVSLELESVGDGIITVNGIEYTKGMKVSIGKESIKINVTDGSRTTGYELIIRE